MFSSSISIDSRFKSQNKDSIIPRTSNVLSISDQGIHYGVSTGEVHN